MATKKNYNTVRELLNSEQRWIKYTLAARKKPFGLLTFAPVADRTNPRSNGAVCFCLLGACQRIYPEGKRRSEVHQSITAAIWKLFPDFRTGTIAYFNDSCHTTHKHIKAVLREANV